MAEWREAFCPTCGRTMGMRTVYNMPGKPYFGIESRRNLWAETAGFTGDKPFGVVKSSQGKSSMKFERYYDIDEDAEGYFPFMKARLLSVVGEWLNKGWFTREEVELAMAGQVAPPTAPAGPAAETPRRRTRRMVTEPRPEEEEWVEIVSGEGGIIGWEPINPLTGQSIPDRRIEAGSGQEPPGNVVGTQLGE